MRNTFMGDTMDMIAMFIIAIGIIITGYVLGSKQIDNECIKNNKEYSLKEIKEICRL